MKKASPDRPVALNRPSRLVELNARSCARNWMAICLVSQTLALVMLLGCSEAPVGPPSISAELRQSIKQDLITLGAKVTAEDSAGLYASLRNTHVEVQPSGGVIESAPRSRQDLQDFGKVNEAVAKEFLDAGEFAAFQQWLKTAMSPASPNAVRTEYARLQLNMSRTPLRVVFSQRAPVVE